MPAWRKGRQLLGVLERKKNVVLRDIIYIDNRLADIARQIILLQQEYDDLHQQINTLFPSGISSRSEIYQCIRQQGVLLSQQQIIFQQIISLQDRQATEQQQRQQRLQEMHILERRHYKVNLYLQRIRRELLLHADMRAENENQEVVGYGGKDS